MSFICWCLCYLLGDEVQLPAETSKDLRAVLAHAQKGIESTSVQLSFSICRFARRQALNPAASTASPDLDEAA